MAKTFKGLHDGAYLYPVSRAKSPHGGGLMVKTFRYSRSVAAFVADGTGPVKAMFVDDSTSTGESFLVLTDLHPTTGEWSLTDDGAKWLRENLTNDEFHLLRLFGVKS